ncbi:MAG: hypothetical protein CYPHOPRED_005304 [Cyphobasidiales sp. Tagirdzhanova-0007]|nr:MAG: hypothetical protein CYPHOPRED_005304 [Cyphobasidiales sp. Tagirdzhanova-0007]
MSFLARSSGPKSQLLAWTAISGGVYEDFFNHRNNHSAHLGRSWTQAGLATYIYFKGRTGEKKKLDMMAGRIHHDNRDIDGVPVRRRGGVGLSSAGAAYPGASPSSSSNSSPTPASHFLPQTATSPNSHPPMTLAEYRLAMITDHSPTTSNHESR